jgi:hypothetical protein
MCAAVGYIVLNLDGPLSTRPRNLRQFWKDNPQLSTKIQNLEKDFAWIQTRTTKINLTQKLVFRHGNNWY